MLSDGQALPGIEALLKEVRVCIRLFFSVTAAFVVVAIRNSTDINLSIVDSEEDGKRKSPHHLGVT